MISDADIYRAIYVAGYVAGLEAAAKCCEEMNWTGREPNSADYDNLDCAPAIRAMNSNKEK